jgi:hypothetical protein
VATAATSLGVGMGDEKRDREDGIMNVATHCLPFITSVAPATKRI